MKENAIKKINQFGKVGKAIATIAQIILIAGFVLCVGATIAFKVMPNDFVAVDLAGAGTITVDGDAIGVDLSKDFNESDFKNEDIQSNVDINGMNFEVSSAVLQNNKVIMNMSASDIKFDLNTVSDIMLAGAVTILGVLIFMYFAIALCKAFANCESPFEENVIKQMQNVAIAIVPMVALQYISNGIMQLSLTGSADITIDLSVVLIILLIFALVYIFKYGAMLQKESDETL